MKELFENVSTRRVIFGCLGICAIVIAIFLCDYDGMVLTMATVSSVILFFRLPYANLPIKKILVRLGWSCSEFSVILLLSSLLNFYSSEGIKVYGAALLTYMFIGAFSYAYFIPWFTEKFNLDEECSANKFFNHNGYLGYLALWTFFFVVEMQVYELACQDVLS